MTGGPTGRRDESVSFSLRELRDLEEDRITREKREASDREADALRAKEEAVRREAEARAAKERSEADAREEQRRRDLEELARHEAMQKAIVEQARLEVDAKTRAQEREREREHEMQLARLRAHQASTKPGLVIGSGIGSALFVLAGAFAIHLAVLKPSTEARLAALTEMATRAEARASEAERRADEHKGRIAALEGDLRAARDVRPTEATKPSATGQKPNRPHGPPTPSRTEPKRTGCDPKDPMCFDPP